MDKLNDVITEAERRLSEKSQRQAAEKRRSKKNRVAVAGPIGSLARGIAFTVRRMNSKKKAKE